MIAAVCVYAKVVVVLQDCVLNVDVERIGHFDAVPSGTLTPRSFQAAPLKHDRLSKLLTTLSKVSGGIDRETESNAQVQLYTACYFATACMYICQKWFTKEITALCPSS